MNDKCNICAKFLICNRKDCRKVSFVEADILDKPKIKGKDRWIDFGMTIQEAEKQL